MKTVYNIPRSVTLSELQTRVNDVFSSGIICKMTSTEITKRLVDRVCEPLNARTPAGRRKHSAYLAGYVQGLVDKWRADIWRYHVEFCYTVDGVLYSTHKDSARRKTAEFYAAGKGVELTAHAESGRHYWKNSEKAY